MSDEQKKTEESSEGVSEQAAEAPSQSEGQEASSPTTEAAPAAPAEKSAGGLKPVGGGLPGLGAKPGGGGLPGLGAKPGGGGLPGLGAKPGGLPGLGAKPGGGGLPGLGAKPGGGGLPGLGAKPMGGGLPGAGGAVPDFIKEKQEKERLAAMARDPFAADNLPSQRPSFVPAGGEIVDTGAALEGADVGKSKTPLLVIGAVLALVFFGVGYGGGLAVNQRGMLNTVLRDAWIIQYEMKQLRQLHGEVQGMVNNALADAQQRKFNKEHVAFLASKVSGNPFDARLFTDRNYKALSPMVVQMMGNLYRNWDKLAALVAEHKAATNNDIKVLSAAGEEFKKLMTTNYGVIFYRDKNNNGQFTGNLVVLGTANGKSVQIQTTPGSFSDEREVYNPSEEGDDKLAKDPTKYVVVIGAQSKKTLLQNATQSHFNNYLARLQEMAKLLKVMEEEQTNMFGPLDDNCSREPVSFLARGVDPEAEFEEYVKNRKSGAAAAE